MLSSSPAQPALWAQSWAEGRTGFHRPEASPELLRFLSAVLPRPGRVLVPLCGKSLDLAYLAAQGHTVVGVELIPAAIEAWIAESGLPVTRGEAWGHPAVFAPGITVLQADIFAVEPETVGAFDLIWDRAALIALPPEARPAYCALIRRLRAPGGQILQQTMVYDPSRFSGPPWTVPDEELFAAYGELGLRLLLEEDGLVEARWRERLDALAICTYQIGAAPSEG